MELLVLDKDKIVIFQKRFNIIKSYLNLQSVWEEIDFIEQNLYQKYIDLKIIIKISDKLLIIDKLINFDRNRIIHFIKDCNKCHIIDYNKNKDFVRYSITDPIRDYSKYYIKDNTNYSIPSSITQNIINREQNNEISKIEDNKIQLYNNKWENINILDKISNDNIKKYVSVNNYTINSDNYNFNIEIQKIDQKIENQSNFYQIDKLLQNINSSDKKIIKNQTNFKKIFLGGKEQFVKKNDIFEYKNKKYFIVRRIKKNIIHILISEFQSIFTSTFIAELLLLSFILFTQNLFLLSFIIAIRVLRMLSKLILKKKLCRFFTSYISRLMFLFLSSIFLIDHNSFNFD